jgi:anti-sigma28 factor (negative regulator of flagellin synthesis)
MKIADMHSRPNLYRKTTAEQAEPKAGKAAAPAKQDIADFAHGTTVTDKAMISTKAGIQNYLSAPAAAERLDSLRQSVKDGAYHVETNDLVDAILGFERVL